MPTSTIERTRLLTHAKSILDVAKSAGRDINDGEAAAIDSDITAIKTLDARDQGHRLRQAESCRSAHPTGTTPKVARLASCSAAR